MEKKPRNCKIIKINTNNKVVPKPEDNIFSARNNVAKAMLDADAPLVSIYVLAYNNLEKHTKTCVECILKYTCDVDYELILVDNGSTDGTFEYFKSVQHPKKKIIRVTKNIGAYYGGNLGASHARGRYIVNMANDIYATKNWLSNLLKCAMSDDRIGMVTPVSDYVSNLQAVNLGYADFDDMQIKAEKFNISDPRKWEERLRLITIGTLYKRECLDMVGLADYGFFHDFGDDDFTFRVRRAGYKAILCKDVFVCHAGRMMDKEASLTAQSLEKGRCTFKNKFYGIDAWDDVNNYEPAMMSLANIKAKSSEAPEILGIDVLCGTPVLELRNKLRNSGIFHARLHSFSSDAKYWSDLKTICEGEVRVDRPEYVLEHFNKEKFDYIVLGKPVNTYREPYKLLGDMLLLLKDEGQLLIKLGNSYDLKAFLIITGNGVENRKEVVSQISLEDFNDHLSSCGYYADKIAAECYVVDENTNNQLKKIFFNSGSVKNPDLAFQRMMVKDYIISIVKRYDS